MKQHCFYDMDDRPVTFQEGCVKRFKKKYQKIKERFFSPTFNIRKHSIKMTEMIMTEMIYYCYEYLKKFVKTYE